jgi:hypothetical protein
MALPKWMTDEFNKSVYDRAGELRAINKPVETKPVVQPKNTSRWDDLSLIDRTAKVNELANYFKSKGRLNPNMDDVVRLAELGYNPSNTDLDMYLSDLVSIDDLTPKSTESKQPSIEGTLTDMCAKHAQKEREDEYRRQQDLYNQNNPPVPTETVYDYPNYY